MAVTGASPGLRQQVGGVQEAPALGGRNRPLDFQEVGGRNRFDLRHRVAQGKRSVLVDPLGEGLEVGEDAVDRSVVPAAGAFFFKLLLEGDLEGLGEARRPLRPVVRADLLEHEREEQRKVTPLDTLGGFQRRHFKPEVRFHPGGKGVRVASPGAGRRGFWLIGGGREA